ncbi:hypothetical protein Acj9p041 [Acinetobacter phage Acj9]|uniref:Uncharacterized protein n=1 Tax=Acinetobacter phage Acj9 TaxID=760939 RepID=E5EPH5_9CAUD|nr:hypothetical protein Acj9p041 [Acinetobacter phage Acj9]ADG59941.1 hypothetical protein Acj9p041 [Acinetobacter phage Acj9]
MNTQKISVAVVCALIIAFVSYMEYTYQNATKQPDVTTVIASGIVTDKSISEYACGSKKLYTCTLFSISVDGKSYESSREMFFATPINASVTLTNTRPYAWKPIEVASKMVHVMTILVFGVIGIIFVGSYVYWLCMWSNTLTFKEFLEKVDD